MGEYFHCTQRERLLEAAVLAAIAAFVVSIRVPFNANLGVDEGFYLVVGRQWLHGLPPYADAFDVKPPLLFALMAGAEALFGPSLAAAKALSAAAAALTACGLYLFGARFLGKLAGLTAAFLYALSVLSLGGTFSPAELLMAPFTAFGWLAGLAAVLNRTPRPLAALLASGVLFGVAACVKQTALFEAAPLVLALLFSRKQPEAQSPDSCSRAGRTSQRHSGEDGNPFLTAEQAPRWAPAWAGTTVRLASAQSEPGSIAVSRSKTLAVFAGGLAVVPAVFALYFLAIGHLRALIEAAVLSAIARANVGYVPWSEAMRLLLTGVLPALPIIALAGVAWVERRRMREHPAYPALRFLGAWTLAALLAILTTKAMFAVYFLPLLQPLCLAAGVFAEHVLGRAPSPARRWAWRAAVLGTASLYLGWACAHYFRAGGEGMEAAEAAAAAMQRAGKRDGDRLLVVDRDLFVYLSANADPPGSVFHPQHLLCPFPFKGAANALADAMDSGPAFVIVANPPMFRVCERKDQRAAVEAKLARNYCALANFRSSVTGVPGSFTVFALKERAGAKCL